jgi:solute:Na+ symporter, SSS family
MIPAVLVFAYLAVVLYIGIFAFRKGNNSGEEFFLAGRRLGPMVFLLSLFGTNMTAFAILGSSGMAYRVGIGVFGLMASSSALVIPLCIYVIGTRLWWLGKKHGHMTQVQYLRDRWECGGIGTFIFAITAAMLVPYIIIGVMGGGETLEAISGHRIPYAVGGGIVALVVMSYVFFGGMRGTAWVNAFQTVLFLCFGAAAFILIGQSLGGFGAVMQKMAENPATAPLLTRQKLAPEEYFSYMFIPLSSIMFPHVAIMCMTAEKITHFKKTVVLYPICIALIWLPSVFLGVVAAGQFPGLPPGETNDVMVKLLTAYTPEVVAGILAAGIMACVMASDSQILALCTMFTEDLFAYYGGKERFGDKAQVWTGRAFIVIIGVVAYVIALALKDKESIFELAIRFAFSGFSALAPVMLAALFWKRSTKWGALAASVWVLFAVLGSWWLHEYSLPIAPKPPRPAPTAQAAPAPSPAPAPTGSASVSVEPELRRQAVSPPPKPPSMKPVPIFPQHGSLFLRSATGVLVYGYMPVVPMTLISALLMWLVSLLTPPPSRRTLEKYFPPKEGAPLLDNA